MKRGQVSTEYLVILAVVLVIALVVVYLVSQSTSLGGSTIETQSQAYWRETQPLAVTGFSAATTNLDLELLNQYHETLTLTRISGSGLTDYTTSTSFAPGQVKTITVTLNTTCGSVGTRYSYGNITFTYTAGDTVISKTFVGQKSLAGTCS